MIDVKLQQLADSLEWLCNAGFRMKQCGKNIYIDPWKLTEPDRADLVLITHSHFDHLDPESLRLIVHEQTTIVCPTESVSKARELGIGAVLPIAAGQQICWEGINIEAVPMYNTQKPQFHPRANGWVGYVLEFDGLRLYHAGDTERTPEMANVACDLVLMPLGQTYTMNSVDEAAQCVIDTKARMAIPMHFDVHESQPGDSERFAQLLSGHAEVVIKKPLIAHIKDQ